MEIAEKRFRIFSLVAVSVFMLVTVGCHRPVEKPDFTSQELQEVFKEVLTVAINQPDSAMLMIEKLRVGDSTLIPFRQGSVLPDYYIDLLRAKVFAQSLEDRRPDSAIIIAERLLRLDVARTDLDFRQNVLGLLIAACRDCHDDEQTIHWTAQLIDLCRERGDKTEMLRNEAEIGLLYSSLGRQREGLAKIDSVITLLSGKRKFNEMDASIIALKRKINVLSKAGRHTEVLPVAQTILGRLADFEAHPDEFHDGSHREIPANLRPGYIDFYRSQAYAFMAEAYARLSPPPSRLSPLEKARHYLTLFERGDFARTFAGRRQIAPVWGLLGEYDKMEAIYGEVMAHLREQNDTLNAEFASIIRDRATAAEAQGRSDDALRLHRQYEQLCESNTDRLLQGKAHLYAARFHAAEQQQKIEQQKIAHRHVCIVALCIGIAALIAVLFAVFALWQRRREQQKNHVLVKQISETLDYKKMYEHLKYAASTAPEPSPPVAQAGITDLAALSNADLFGYLSEVIIRERMYLDPAFERQTLADRFHLSDHRLGTAFSQGSSYKSLPDFIRCLRLEYACELLRERPDLTVSEVANQSGFSNLTVFSRCFKATYMMAPSVFRHS